jgi:hypothetical protein
MSRVGSGYKWSVKPTPSGGIAVRSLMSHREGNPAMDDDRTEWDKAWRERPLRRLVNPVPVDVAPTPDPAWGKVLRVDVAADPPQFTDRCWRKSEVCPVCGEVATSENRIAASIYPYFEIGFSYGLYCWVHEACLLSCEEIAGPAPVPW